LAKVRRLKAGSGWWGGNKRKNRKQALGLVLMLKFKTCSAPDNQRPFLKSVRPSEAYDKSYDKTKEKKKLLKYNKIISNLNLFK
jgi:hypothetical protein